MRNRAVLVLIVSGVIGFRLGMVTAPHWQVAVETAQVVAGVVRYPDATPFFLYHMNLWTVLHQVLAVLLRMGISEVTLSLALSGVLGMVTSQGLSMFIYALSGDAIVAIGAPLIILAARAADFGVVYPIVLAGSVNTYGVLGLSLFVLIVGLLGVGSYRLGGFLLGLAPAVHPSLGFWLFVIVGVVFVWDIRRMREVSGDGLRYFVAGCLVTGVSLLIHWRSSFVAPPIDPSLANQYLRTFVSLWDGHRQPVSMGQDGVNLNRGALSLALLWLTAFRTDLPRHAEFLLRVVIVAAALSLIFVMLSWIPPERMPATFLILMPTRLANFNAMTCVALLVGIIAAYRTRPWSPALMLLLTMGLLLGERSLVWQSLLERGRVSAVPGWAAWLDIWPVLEIASVALIALTAAAWYRGRGPEKPEPIATPWRAAATGARWALVGVIATLGIVLWQRVAPRGPLFQNYETNPVFHEAAKGTGLLITGGNLDLIQLRTRRPVLLNGGGLDGLPYALDSGPATERILRDVYGIDFFNPPEEARRVGILPNRYNQQLWERFSPEQWHAIRYMYQVRQVLTYANWSLNLPVIAQDRDLRLYQIPD